MRNKILHLSFKNFTKLFSPDILVTLRVREFNEGSIGKIPLSNYNIYYEDQRISMFFNFIKNLWRENNIVDSYPPYNHTVTSIEFSFMFEDIRYDYRLKYNSENILMEELFINFELAVKYDHDSEEEIEIGKGWIKYSNNEEDDNLLLDCYYNGKNMKDGWNRKSIVFGSMSTISDSISKFLKEYCVIYDEDLILTVKEQLRYDNYINGFDKTVIDKFREIAPKLFPDTRISRITEDLNIEFIDGYFVHINNFSGGSGYMNFLILGPLLLDSVINNRVILANSYLSEYHPMLRREIDKIFSSKESGQLIYID